MSEPGDRPDVTQAPLAQTGHGLIPAREGWFVLNARDAQWEQAPGRSATCDFEGEVKFSDLGINLSVLGPGQAMAMYHWEHDQEDFLILAGEALLIVEGVERPVRRWDFIHCPAGTRHVLIGAGERSCLVLAVGARRHSAASRWGGYVFDATASGHGASAEQHS
jgi:mannose-6-phosphate isomerase-like protein (cupin superfamily)